MIPAEWLQYAPQPEPLKPNQKWNVFLSYRSVNRGWVLNLYDILTELKFKVFLDQYVLKPGDSLVRTLEDGLESSQGGILVWSNAARDSEWVRNEYDTLLSKATDDKQFHFIPIKIDRAPLPTFAKTKLFIDFTEYPDGPNGGDLLRLIHALVGKSLSDEAVHFAWEQDEASGIAAAQINAAIRNDRPQKLLQLYIERGLPWKTTAALSCKTAEGLSKLGYNDEAIDMLEKVELEFKKAIRPKQLKALALARREKEGDLDKAQDILGELYELNHLDPETLGIYGRTWMDRYAKSKDVKHLRQSRNYYAEAFEKAPDDYYTGINAATKSVFLGTPEDLEKAKGYAQRTQQITGTEPCPGDYWKTATIGELLLIERKYKESGEMYQKAVEIAPSEKEHHKSTWKQAVRLMEKLQPAEPERMIVLAAFKELPDYDKLEMVV